MKRILAGWVTALAAACVDPHARPVSPEVQFQFPPGLQVHSPGTIPNNVYAFAPSGLEQVEVHITSSDASFFVDSLRFVVDTNETTQSYIWQVPSGLASGVTITLTATVTDVIGLTAKDSTQLLIQ